MFSDYCHRWLAALNSSASVFNGSPPRWLASISHLDLTLLRNGLEQWGLLRLPCLHQEATVYDNLRQVCLPTAICRVKTLPLLVDNIIVNIIDNLCLVEYDQQGFISDD
jgi:hypothetical protein